MGKNPNHNIKANVNISRDSSYNIHWLLVSSVLTSGVCSILFDSTSEGESGRTILGMKSNLHEVEIRKLICLNYLKLRLKKCVGCNCCHQKSSFCIAAKGLKY